MHTTVKNSCKLPMKDFFFFFKDLPCFLLSVISKRKELHYHNEILDLGVAARPSGESLQGSLD